MKFLLIGMLVIYSFSIMAQRGPANPGEKPPFVTACSSLSAGESCTYVGRDGASITGVCTEKSHPQTGASELVCWSIEMEKMREGGPSKNEKKAPPRN